MASSYASVKLSSTFVDEVRQEASVVHRSVGAQVEYWARLGRAVENAPGFGIDRVRQALDGRLTLETLSVEEQDAVFDRLDDQFDNPPADVKAQYAELGRREGAVGADTQGRLVRREASGRARRTA
jgi:ParD-like antitoxin of type II bacterial toxin-antitoxin system